MQWNIKTGKINKFCKTVLNRLSLDLTWSWFYFSTAAVVPVTGVGSRRLDCLTPALQATLLNGSVLSRLHTVMSVLTHSDQLFLGLPLPRRQGIFKFITVLMQEEDLAACPYHLSRLVRKASVTSWIPSLAHRVSVAISWSGLIPRIQRIIDLSFLLSLCRSVAVGAQLSLPCSIWPLV